MHGRFPKPGSLSAVIVTDLEEAVLSHAAIAAKHGCSAVSVTKARRKAVEAGALPARDGEWVVAFGDRSGRLRREIEMEALARGVDAKELVRALVTAVVERNLFDRVLGPLR